MSAAGSAARRCGSIRSWPPPRRSWQGARSASCCPARASTASSAAAPSPSSASRSARRPTGVRCAHPHRLGAMTPHNRCPSRSSCPRHRPTPRTFSSIVRRSTRHARQHLHARARRSRSAPSPRKRRRRAGGRARPRSDRAARPQRARKRPDHGHAVLVAQLVEAYRAGAERFGWERAHASRAHGARASG